MPKPKTILIICKNEVLKRLKMQKTYGQLGGHAVCRITDGIIKAGDDRYIFRAISGDYRHKIMNMEVTEIIFDEGVPPEDQSTIRQIVRIKT